VTPAARAVVHCQGCGAEASPDDPTPQRCGHCPPVLCPDCGQMDAMDAPCPCWVSLEGMNLADLKGVLARGDLEVTPSDGAP